MPKGKLAIDLYAFAVGLVTLLILAWLIHLATGSVYARVTLMLLAGQWVRKGLQDSDQPVIR